MSLNFSIRQEEKSDFSEVYQLIERAFRGMPFSDQTEHLLVEQLRKDASFLPELSLVAHQGDKVIGHILFSLISINDNRHSFKALTLAPVSVDVPFQRKGVGSALILEGHRIAKDLGYKAIFLVGHPSYYSRFGYDPLANYDIRLPFEIPLEYCMAKELVPGALRNISGMAAFPEAFFE